MKRVVLFILLVSICFGGDAADYYVAVTNVNGDGTLSSPFILESAITNSSIVGGDTVWLRGGTHTSSVPVVTWPSVPWTIKISGSAGNLITWRSYSNEWAKIDRKWLFGTTKYNRFQDLEFFDSFMGRNPTNLPSMPNGPWAQFDDSNATAAHNEWINCLLHDVDDLWDGMTAGDSVRGCVIWNVGLVDGEYVNSPGNASGTNDFSGNIVGFTASEVLHLNPAGQIANSNIVFGSGALVGGGSIMFSLSGYVALTNNLTYFYAPSFVFQETLRAGGSQSFAVGNVFVGQIPIKTGSGSVFGFFSNTVYQIWTGANYPVIDRTDTNGTWSLNGNSYYAISPNIVRFYDGASDVLTFAQWKSRYSTFDTTSTASDSTHPPDSVYVVPNRDTAKRAHVAVYNWTHADNVSVSLSGVLTNGDTYQLYSAQNYGAGVISTGSYNGTSISLPMTNLTVAPILYATNWGLTTPSVTSPEFAAFVVVGASTNVPPPAGPTVKAILANAVIRNGTL